MAATNVVYVKLEVDQEKIDRLNAAEDRFREASHALSKATDELRDAMNDLRDPFVMVRTTAQTE